MNKKYKYADLERLDVDRGTIARFNLTNYPEKDEKLPELLEKADMGEIPVYQAIVPLEKIIPFCNFKPEKQTMKYLEPLFLEQVKEGIMPPLNVYPENGLFVMSTDYHAYYFYIEQGFKEVPCIIFGD